MQVIQGNLKKSQVSHISVSPILKMLIILLIPKLIYKKLSENIIINTYWEDGMDHKLHFLKNMKNKNYNSP